VRQLSILLEQDVWSKAEMTPKMAALRCICGTQVTSPRSVNIVGIELHEDCRTIGNFIGTVLVLHQSPAAGFSRYIYRIVKTRVPYGKTGYIRTDS